MTLTTQQQSILDLVDQKHNIFISGPPGSGKSYVLSHIVKRLKNYALTATTGTAAVNIGGQTIHSYFGLKPYIKDYNEHSNYLKKERYYLYKNILHLKCLIIEEISMLDNILFEGISTILKKIKGNDKPFGNIQVIFVGDFYQLKPVENDYCFLSEEWKNINFKEVYLNILIRQKDDEEFKEILSSIRKGKINKTIYQRLEQLKNTEFPEHIKPTKLFPKNKDVDRINFENIKNLNKPFKLYKALFKDLKENTDYDISLCENAQIMVTRNIATENGIVNGTRGILRRILSESVIIELLDGTKYEVTYYKDYINKEKTKWIEFLPIKIAYAISIHKSQGATLDAIEIDLGSNVFCESQAYVALSRGRNLKYIRISELSTTSFKIDKRVLDKFE
tara:strand:- start:623 stop:1798 length:1176 start_codon:yes stop_codon:yes gene_type:complete